MAAPMEEASSRKILAREGFCLIEATVVTGFESVAKEEVEERFSTNCIELRGRIKFECPLTSVESVSRR